MATKKKVTPKQEATATSKQVDLKIPKMDLMTVYLGLAGDRPLMTSNKMNIAEAIALTYGSEGGATGKPKVKKPTPEEMYRNAFYVMGYSDHDPPSELGDYGIPASGIKKCFCSAIRQTGITNNTVVGVIQRSFLIQQFHRGLAPMTCEYFEMDTRAAGIGQGNKTPDMRYRPMFHEWEVIVEVTYNPVVMTLDQLVNLGRYAGFYVGWGELRAEKMQGECGGFTVKTYDSSNLPDWYKKQTRKRDLYRKREQKALAAR